MPLTIEERLECLRLATTTLPYPIGIDEMLKRATAYLAFVQGKSDDTPTTEDTTPSKPKPEKAKKTKEETAPSQDALLDQLDGTMQRSKASFEDAKTMTLKVRDQVDAAALRSILDGFGAKTIQDLKEAQWAEYVQKCTATIANHWSAKPAVDDFGV